MRKPKMYVALVGTSGFARNYVRSAEKYGVEITWVFSRSLQRAKDFIGTHKLSARPTENLSDVLNDSKITAVVITTEPSRHLDLAEPCLAANKHILIEKPLDSDLEKAKKFYDKYKTSPLAISVSSPRRFDPILLKMKRQWDERLDKGPAIANLSMLWSRKEAYYKSGNGWRSGEGGSVLLNQAIHWIDVCQWFFGDIKSYTSKSIVTKPFLDCADQSILLMNFANSVQVSFVATTALTKQYTDKFDIYFADRRISYEELMSKSKFKTRIMSRFQAIPMDLQFKDFLEAVRNKTQPSTNLANGLKALEIASQASRLDN